MGFGEGVPCKGFGRPASNTGVTQSIVEVLSAMDIRELVRDRVETVRAIMLQINEASWLADTLGDSEQRLKATEARKRLAQVLSDPDDYQALRGAPPQDDPLLARQVDMLTRRARNQMTPEEIAEQAHMEEEIEEVFVHFRAELDGRSVSENDINEILRDEQDTAARRRAWEASKQIGRLVAPKLVELVEARNRAARRMGYRDFFAMSLALDELDEDELFALMGALAAATDELFAREKGRIDGALAARFGVEPGSVGPWHYSDPFFQRAPDDGSLDLDYIFKGKDLPKLASRFFAGIGMDVEDILARSDLYERPGKYQHAYCNDMDREGDIRTICNLRDNHDWMSTLLHELGHGVYFKYIDRSLPWALREHAHTLTTEAVAMIMGNQVFDARWLVRIAGVDEDEAARIESAAARRSALQSLVFIRWCLALVNFERELCANPRRDLNALWRELVAVYQGTKAPDGRDEPDWAAKIHVALYPVYYQNYMLGELLAAQMVQAIAARAGTASFTDMPEVGQWFVDEVFAPGARWHWNELVRRATGSPLGAQAFTERLAILTD